MKFIINYKKHDTQMLYRATDWASFESEVWNICLWVSSNPNDEKDYEFIVEGKILSLDLAQKAATFARKEWEAKRAEKKKQIWVRKQGTHGNTQNNFHQIWVNK
jgi:hypothetical protein